MSKYHLCFLHSVGAYVTTSTGGVGAGMGAGISSGIGHPGMDGMPGMGGGHGPGLSVGA